MHSTTSCDCNGINCRSQVVMPESQSTPPSLYRKFKNAEKIAANNYAAEQCALNIDSPESPKPQEIHEEFPCYTQSFLEEENDNAMDVGDVTNNKEAPTPSLEDVKPEKKVRKKRASYSVSSDYGYPTDSDSGSGYGSIKDLSDGAADGKVSEDPSPSLGDDKPKKDRKRPASCAISDDEYFHENADSDSDDEDSHSLPCKVEVGDEIERKKRELDERMEMEANDRYLSFSEKFGIDKKNCNLTIAEFYFNEIQKLSGIV